MRTQSSRAAQAMLYHLPALWRLPPSIARQGVLVGKRYLFLLAALALMLVAAWPSLSAESASALDLFFWLLVMLVIAGLALWPSSGRVERAELALERRGWADRVEFGEAGKTTASAAAPPAAARLRRPKRA